MRSFAAASLLAALAAAQTTDYAAQISSIEAGQASFESLIQTASDPGAAAQSYISQLTRGFSPEEQSAYSSLTAEIGLDTSALFAATDSAEGSSAIASITSQAAGATSTGAGAGVMTSASALTSMHGTTVMHTGSGSSSAAAAGSTAAMAAAPSNYAFGGLLGVAGAFGAAALLL